MGELQWKETLPWYESAVFYHIYPLGMCDAPKKREDYTGEPAAHFREMVGVLPHLKELGISAMYIGPLFESEGHGYETDDYYKVDARLGSNEDFKQFVAACHETGIRVVVDGVFNHSGRGFFAFQDLKQNREGSAYRDWYCGVNFGGNNEFNDGFSYEAWHGFNILPRFNLKNPAVKNYLLDVIRFWEKEFDIDGIRLDCADVLDFDFMREMRALANQLKPNFWLMGEVIHGDYSRWVNGAMLHSVTNYELHKGLYSGHNDHNYFEIAHTVKYVSDMVGNILKLYSFVDNHDVERIYTKLTNKAHFLPVHVMLYTLPGVPSIYYGSEFGIEGRKERFSDDSLRPALNYEDYKDAINTNPCTKLIAALGKIRQNTPALCYGDYQELELKTTHYAYARTLGGKSVITTVNNGDNDAYMDLVCGDSAEYVGALKGERVSVNGGRIQVRIPANEGEIWIPAELCGESFASIKTVEIEKAPEPKTEPVEQPKPEPVEQQEEKKPEKVILDWNKPYEDMSVEELQEAILEQMRRNGPVTDYMLGTVRENTYRDSLVNWVKSFQ